MREKRFGNRLGTLDFIRCGFDLGTQITGARNRIDAGGPEADVVHGALLRLDRAN
jgi:hypothetical protein